MFRLMRHGLLFPLWNGVLIFTSKTVINRLSTVTVIIFKVNLFFCSSTRSLHLAAALKYNDGQQDATKKSSLSDTGRNLPPFFLPETSKACTSECPLLISHI